MKNVITFCGDTHCETVNDAYMMQAMYFLRILIVSKEKL
jgi:hypothetical protein